jgi:co-chaperonin GroES (HSP10)
MNLELLGDRILITKIEKTSSKGGILLPQNAQSGGMQMCEGIVVKVGCGYVTKDGTRIVPTVQYMDKVYFISGTCGEFEYQDKKYGILNEGSVIAYERPINE